MSQSKPSNAGIVTDAASGERHIPESVRADGSTRRAIKIRPGYQPPEDVKLYKNRTAESFRKRYNGGVPGAEAAATSTSTTAGSATGDKATAGSSNANANASASANKNAKRREARRKAAAAAASTTSTTSPAATEKASTKEPVTEKKNDEAPVVDPAAEREKKARGLKKKLKQARELQTKREGGETLLPEQIAKVIRISELVRELQALGFDGNGEPKAKAEEKVDEKAT